MIPFIKDSPHAGWYVACWKKAREAYRENPDTIYERGFVNWWPESASKIYQGFLDAMENRINLRGGMTKRGRKDDYDWFCRARRDQRAIQRRVTERVRVYQFETKECRKRFSHLLSDYREDW